jgi:hypothetical protein
METVRIRGLAEGREALARARAEGRRIAVASIPDGAASAGALWFAEIAAILRAEFPETLADAILDCGVAPGTALGALRAGAATLAYSGPHAPRLAEIAAASGARLADPGDAP